MTAPNAAVTVAFRNADTGRACERVIWVKAGSWRTDDDIAADAKWIVQSWRNVDRDSVDVVKVERAEALLAKHEVQRTARAGVAT